MYFSLKNMDLKIWLKLKSQLWLIVLKNLQINLQKLKSLNKFLKMKLMKNSIGIYKI